MKVIKINCLLLLAILTLRKVTSATLAEACYSKPDGTVLPLAGTCTAYIFCLTENVIVLPCPAGTGFSEAALGCIPMAEADCQQTVQTTQATTTGTGTTVATVCPPLNGVDGKLCQHATNGTLYPYLHNGNAYINCMDGCAILNHCPEHQQFNQLLRICDTTDVTHSSQQGTLPTITTATTLPAEDDEICRHEPDHALLPYAGDCSKFVMCLEGAAVLLACPDGFLFNYKLAICDENADDGCYHDTATASVELSTTSTPIENFCLDQAYGVTFPYPENCQYFYFCWGDNRTTVLSCPTNSWYSPRSGACGPHVSADACRDTYVPTTTLGTPTQSTDHTGVQLCAIEAPGTTLPVQGTCTQYILCRGHSGYITMNCTQHEYYNPSTGECGSDVSSTACLNMTSTKAHDTTASPIPPTICTDSSDYTTYAIAGNCSQFIICMAHEPTLMECFPGAYFDPALGNCHPSTDADLCRQFAHTTPATSGNTIPPAAPQTPNICDSKHNGELVAYPGACHKYIDCVYPAPIAFTCANNWYFDASTLQCEVATESLCPQTNTTGNTTGMFTHMCAGAPKGDTFPNPTNCQFFIRCNGNNTFMDEMCNWHQNYDAVTGECSSLAPPNACLRVAMSTSTTSPVRGTATSSTSETDVGTHSMEHTTTQSTSERTTQSVIKTTAEVTSEPTTELTTNSVMKTTAEVTSEPIADSTTESIINPASEPSFEPTSESTTEPGLCASQPNGVTFAYPADCRQYIDCVNGTEQLRHCLSGTFYNPKVGNCSNGTSSKSCLEISRTTSSASTTQTTEVETSTTISPSTPNHKSPFSACHGYRVGSVQPYANNCSKFIICERPTPLTYSCPPGLEFNAATLKCMAPELANCSTDKSAASEITSTSTPMPIRTTSIAYNISKCAHLSDGTTLPLNEDCRAYVYCYNRLERHVICQPGSYYNPSKNMCDREATATDCRQTSASTKPTAAPASTAATTATPTKLTTKAADTTAAITTEATTAPSVPATTAALLSTPNATPTRSPSAASTPSTTRLTPAPITAATRPIVADHRCAHEPDGTTLSDKHDCSRYVICVNKYAHHVKCPIDTYFNPWRRHCDKQTSAAACREIATTTTLLPSASDPTTTTATTTLPYAQRVCLGKPANTRLPYAGDRRKYVICQKSNPIVRQCPPSQIFDSVQLECRSVSPTTTTTTPTSIPVNYTDEVCRDKLPGSQVQYVGDCTKYNFCFGGFSYVLSCSNNWYYNPEYNQCVSPRHYRCPW